MNKEDLDHFVHFFDEDNWDSIQHCGLWNSDIVCEILVNCGLDLNKTNDFGYRALNYAIDYQSEAVLDILLSCPSIELNYSKNNPLQCAFDVQNAKFVVKLLDAGADPNFENLNLSEQIKTILFLDRKTPELIKDLWKPVLEILENDYKHSP